MPECYDGLMRINHRQIEAFRAVFQTGSMTAAGALIGVTQPAISRLIRDLEGEIGWSLFDRSAGKLIPTPDAVALPGGTAQLSRARPGCRRRSSAWPTA